MRLKLDENLYGLITLDLDFGTPFVSKFPAAKPCAAGTSEAMTSTISAGQVAHLLER
jgi:hypothetical protein